MSSFDPAHYTVMPIDPRTNHEVEQLLIETRRIQSSPQSDDLRRMISRLGKLESIMESSGLEGARLLCSNLSQLSKALIRNPCSIDSSHGFEALGGGTLRLAEYMSLVSSRIPISALELADVIIRIQQLLGNSTITPLDLFNPCARCSPGGSGTSPHIESMEKLQAIDQAFHVMFREHLSIYLMEKRSRSLEVMSELFDRIKFDNRYPLSQLAYLVSSCIELVQYESDKFGVHKIIGVLFAEVDFLIRKICCNTAMDGRIEFPETLFQKMLFLIGDAVYGRDRVGHICPQDIGPDTGKICELFRLEKWFTGSPDQVMQAECEKSIQLAGELSQLNRKRNYHSLKNSLALFFLGGLNSEKTTEMLERLDELKEVVSEHADSVLKTYVVCLCETITSIDINAEGLPDSREDTKIASAWMMLWDFVEDPRTLTIEKIHCLGQRIVGVRTNPVGVIPPITRDDVQQENFHADNVNADYSLDSDVNFMLPWPSREFTKSSNALITEISKNCSTVTDILTGTGKGSVGGIRSGEVQVAIKQIECLFVIAGDAPAAEMIRRVGSLIDQAVYSGDHAGEFAEELVLIVDSIREEAVMMINDANPVRDSDPGLDRIRDLIEECLARRETSETSQANSDYGLIVEQLHAIRSGLKTWQTDLADREIVASIRKGFSNLSKLCVTRQHEEISRICNVVVPMISEENLKTTFDSAVVLNLLLEVHQSIEAELKEDTPHVPGHLGSILRMVERL